MPEFFQSVKSSNYGGANNFIGYAFGANEEVPQRDLLNFPYSRAQDVVGASMATPSVFYKYKKFSSNFGLTKNYKDIIMQRREPESKKRPMTGGVPGFGKGSMDQSRQRLTLGQLKKTASIAYFDQDRQIFGICGKNF